MSGLYRALAVDFQALAETGRPVNTCWPTRTTICPFPSFRTKVPWIEIVDPTVMVLIIRLLPPSAINRFQIAQFDGGTC